MMFLKPSRLLLMLPSASVVAVLFILLETVAIYFLWFNWDRREEPGLVPGNFHVWNKFHAWPNLTSSSDVCNGPTSSCSIGDGNEFLNNNNYNNEATKRLLELDIVWVGNLKVIMILLILVGMSSRDKYTRLGVSIVMCIGTLLYYLPNNMHERLTEMVQKGDIVAPDTDMAMSCILGGFILPTWTLAMLTQTWDLVRSMPMSSKPTATPATQSAVLRQSRWQRQSTM